MCVCVYIYIYIYIYIYQGRKDISEKIAFRRSVKNRNVLIIF